MEFNDGITMKLNRLKSLRAAGSQVREVQTEMADLLRDLQGSGLSDEMIEGRTSPSAYVYPATAPEPSLDEKIDAAVTARLAKSFKV